MLILLVALYALGGFLELLGVLTVALAIYEDRRSAAELRRRPEVRAATSPRSFGNSIHRMFEERHDPVGSAIRDARAASKTQHRNAIGLAQEARAQRDALLEILTGGTRLRVAGVGLLVLGLVVSVAGNIISAVAT
jgi:hypothetical protein